MALIQFVQNYQDLSTDRGFQFKFHCDKCGNGYMTRFQTSTFGVAEAALGIASNLFGGISTRRTTPSTRSSAPWREGARRRARGGRSRKGRPTSTNAAGARAGSAQKSAGTFDAGLCDGCAPKFQQEMAAAHAQAKVNAARVQLNEAANKVDYAAGVNLSANAVMRAPPNAPAAQSGVGAPHCTGCGTALAEGVKFCPQCGVPRTAPGCPGCGAAIQAATKFCGQCGTKYA